MARIRNPLSWGRKRAVPEDASFFESAGAWRPRPDSPEVSVFSPEEEAESDARWRRAVLRERFTGPVSGAEKLGFGLSAAGLAALASLDGQSGEDEDGETLVDDAGAAPLPDAVPARKPVAAGDAEKPAVTTKPVSTTHAFLDGGVENVFISPASARADNGVTVRRAAPRGSGAPLEARPISGTERADAPASRKAEAAPTEARAASVAEGVFAARGAVEASAAAMAIAMDFYVPDARAEEGQAQAKAAAVAAKAERGRAPAEAQGEAAIDAQPAAARAEPEPDRDAVAEARGPEVADDAPAAAEGKVSDGGRGGGEAAEATARPRAKDVVAATAPVQAETRDGEEAAEAPVEAKAKDVAASVESGSGLGSKAVKAPARAEAVEVEAVGNKSFAQDRSASDLPGQQSKPKDASAVHEIKAETLRDPSAAPEQAMVKDALAVADAGAANTAPGWNAVAASGRAKAGDGALADKVAGEQAKTGAPAQVTKPIDVTDAAAIAGKVDRPAQATDAALQQTKEVGGKVDPATGQVTQPGQAKDTATAVDTVASGSRDLAGGNGQVKDIATAVETVASGSRDLAAANVQVKDASGAAGTKLDAGLGGSTKSPAGQGSLKDLLVAETGPGAARDVKDAPPPADAKTGVVQTVGQAKDGLGAGATKVDGVAADPATTPLKGLGQPPEATTTGSKSDVKDGAETAKNVPIFAATDPLQATGRAKDVADNVETKVVDGAGDPSKALSGVGAAKDTPPVTVGSGPTEASGQPPIVPVVAKTEADGPPAPAEPAGPAKGTGVALVEPPKADRGSIEPVDAGKGEVKGAALPEQANGAAQPGTAVGQNGGAGVLDGTAAAPSLPDTLPIAVTDLWPASKDGGGLGDTIVLTVPDASPAVPPATDLKGIGGGQGTATVIPPLQDAPPNAGGALPSADNGGVAVAPSPSATDGAPGKSGGLAPIGGIGDTGAALPAQQAIPHKAPAVAPEQAAATQPSGAPGDGVSSSRTTNGGANGDASALDHVLNLFVPVVPDVEPTRPGQPLAGPGSISPLGPDAGLFVLEVPPHQGFQDLPLL